MLAIGAVSGVFQWYSNHSSMDSRQALRQAQRRIDFGFAQAHIKPRLAQIIPPQGDHAEWRFEYRKPEGLPLTVAVSENGQTRLL